MLEENIVLIVDGGGQEERLFISDDVSDWCILQIGRSDGKEDKQLEMLYNHIINEY